MSQVLFSIIIPTRQRHDTLKYSIQSVSNQTYKEFELIIMDNFSTPETAEVVDSFNDPRIKYYRASERLSMSDNWELGLSYATGEYIFVLGDDDALMPDGLEIAFNLINDSDLSIISWNRFFYWWPSAIVPWRRDRLRMTFSQESGVVNSHKKLQQYCNYQITYEFLPMVYNSFIHQDLIAKIKSIHGKYFMSYCPDVASGILNAYFSEKYFYSFRALSLIGVSGHSTGTSASYQSLNPKPYQAYLEEEKKDITAKLHPRLIPSKDQYITLADVMLQTKELYFPETQEFDVNIEQLLKRMSLRINVDPGNYENTLNDIKLLAQKHQIPLSSLNIPPKMAEEHEPPQGPFLDASGSITTLIINCEQAGISDVAQAAMLAQGILPPKEAFITSIKSAYPVIFQKTNPKRTTSIQQTVSSSRFLNELIGCVNLYQIDPSDLLIQADLQKLRKQLADFWLSATTDKLETLYSSNVGKAHGVLLNSGIKDELLPANEQAFVDELIANAAQVVNQPKAIHYLLAASLYVNPERLPMPADVSPLPNWFLNNNQNLAKI